MAEVRVMALGEKAYVEAVLLHRTLRNVLSAVYLAIKESTRTRTSSNLMTETQEQLRTQANIPDPVTHVSETTEPHTPPLLDSQGQLTNPGRKESQWEDLEKGELISLVEKLTEEASRSNIKIKSLQHDRDLIIQHKEVFASALRIGDRLIASKQRESIVITKNQPVSALASTIAATGTDTTPPVIPTITSATGTDTRPTSQVTIPTVTNNTTTAQSDTEETNPNSAGPATSPHPPPVASSTPTTRKRGGKRREKGKTRNPSQQQQALLQPNLPLQPILPQSRPSFPQPDTWRQNQGVQWIPPHQYPYITTPHQRHHTLTHFPFPSWHVQGQGVPVTN
ncbi:hypothetical protein Pcinc_001272 [Petrolisthes cinctipes]|uniref:Uncharacterized protein n=1 Tax=Petrolisthes cinctipes TaxID=88211 RepID=A0AAE1GNL8_PETCI|nr:hypothetical protein Pcinc_001272 [Petrolisthes cinctipes]